jgi:transketolase
VSNFEWTQLDTRAVDTARILAADAVERAGNGHPGTAMSLAPAAYLLFQKFLRHDPTDTDWIGRDRFVLSNGHSSLTLYTELFYSGYGLELSDLKSFRKSGSLTPGHPEFGRTLGVETTTGPLGQGLSTAVGMAYGQRYERGLFDPDADPGQSPFDYHVYVLCGDGDLEEGITSEASSLAGLQQLGNMTVIWDDNHISIEDDTAIAFAEDVLQRYESYGWHVQSVDMNRDGSADIAALDAALAAARDEVDRPSFIQLRTIIGWPAPNLQNTGTIHGAAMGAEEIARTKEALGFDPDNDFPITEEVLAHARRVRDRGIALHERWNVGYNSWRTQEPDRAALLDRIQSGQLPQIDPPQFEPGAMIATRKASHAMIQSLAAALPELIGGSADLAGSNLTTIEGAASFLPADIKVKSDSPFAGPHSPYGRVLHFGIREHAMGAIVNGMSLDGLLKPFGGTFFVFSDYMRGSVRLSALMEAPVVFVWTHDSIGVGEDGPTHQPIEQLWSLRAMPQLNMARPADATETVAVWQSAIERRTPTGLALSRQGVPCLDRNKYAPAADAAKGAYILSEAAGGSPDVLILATGSEVSLGLEAQELLAADGIAARVVSMPCLEWFDEQEESYRDHVLPPSVRARVSIEAGATLGWWKYVGDHGEVIGIDHFGESADGGYLLKKLGFTAENTAAAAKKSLTSVQS